MTLDECLYYLMREMDGGLCADKHFDAALTLIDPSRRFRNIEIDALVHAAQKRGRMEELDAVMKRYYAGQTGQMGFGEVLP